MLLSPSVLGLQRMLNVCGEYAEDHSLLFNEKKSTSIVFAKHKRVAITNPELCLRGSILPYKESIIHLGTIFDHDGTDHLAVDNRCRKFYSAVNAAIAKLGGYCMSDLAWKQIMEVQLFPVLVYGSCLLGPTKRCNC